MFILTSYGSPPVKAIKWYETMGLITAKQLFVAQFARIIIYFKYI